MSRKMSNKKHFLIINGYSQKSREKLSNAHMTCAAVLHNNMVKDYIPGAVCDIFFVSDDNAKIPLSNDLKKYDGIIWTGCDKTLTDQSDTGLKPQLLLAENILKTSIPCWGTCWGIQVMTVAAGGKVEKNPKPREIGSARKITLTDQGFSHQMYSGKTASFDALASHSDIVTQIPTGAVVLAKNDNTPVQAMAFEYNNTFFWGVQYHPDYNLYEVARLMVVRQKELIAEGFFTGPEDFYTHINRLETLAKDPQRTNLRWQLGIDEDILYDKLRRLEFANWLKHVSTDK